MGGILANKTFHVELLSDNLRIQLNVLDGSARGIPAYRILFKTVDHNGQWPEGGANPDVMVRGSLYIAFCVVYRFRVRHPCLIIIVQEFNGREAHSFQ